MNKLEGPKGGSPKASQGMPGGGSRGGLAQPSGGNLGQAGGSVKQLKTDADPVVTKVGSPKAK